MVKSMSKVTNDSNLEILLSLAAEGNCTCDCVECEDHPDGCWAYDYSYSTNQGYEVCTAEQKDDHCSGKGAGWIEQHVIDVIPDVCDGPPPVVYY